MFLIKAISVPWMYLCFSFSGKSITAVLENEVIIPQVVKVLLE